ncbi:zinc finger BED domain-containing protein RICESLEEPER 2-like protein, partial [Tanacetum coccineum]
KKTAFPTVAKLEFVKAKQQEKPVRKPVKYAKMYRLNAITIKGKEWNLFPRVVLMKIGLRPLNTARPVNTAHPKTTVFYARPMLLNTAKAQAVNTARPKIVKIARPNSAVVNAVRGKPQQDDTGFVNSRCSRHMTGNIAYLSNFKEFDGGYVTFRGGAHGGRISGKGTLKTNSLDFKDILLKILRKDNMYSFDMKNIVPKETLTCLVAKATSDESMLWHRRLGHINFKNINKLVQDNLVRGLPTKRFENDQTCVACLKRKQHRASLVTDDYSRFTWVFFLTTKDETCEILKNFIKEIENLVDKKVKIIRSDNGTEFKNKRRNRTLIEAARTMLADSKLPTIFWAEAVSTACYVQNRVLVVNPHNKTPYELFRGFKPALSFMRPFGCHVTILNTLDNVGKFDGKSDEENKPMIEGNGPISNESTGTQGELNAGTSTQKEEISQDCIVMPIWKDASYFDSPSKDVGNGEPKFATDDQKQVEELQKFDSKLYKNLINFKRLECKKQTMVASSTTKAEYVAAGSCYLLTKGFDAGRKITTAGNQLVNIGCHKSQGTTVEQNSYPLYACLGHLKRGWDTKIPHSSGPSVKVGDEDVHKELGDRIERAATTASSLEAEQNSGNINKTQSMAILNGSSP